jgi:hypothetical protein
MQVSTTTLHDMNRLHGFKPSIKISVEKNSIVPKNLILEPKPQQIPLSLQQPLLNVQNQNNADRRKNHSLAIMKLKKAKSKEA